MCIFLNGNVQFRTTFHWSLFPRAQLTKFAALSQIMALLGIGNKPIINYAGITTAVGFQCLQINLLNLGFPRFVLCRVRFHSHRNLLQQLLWPDFAYYIVVGCFWGWLYGFALFSFLWYSKFLLKFLLHFELKYESPTPFQFSSFHRFPNALLIYMHTFLFTLSSYIFIINWLIK